MFARWRPTCFWDARCRCSRRPSAWSSSGTRRVAGTRTASRSPVGPTASRSWHPCSRRSSSGRCTRRNQWSSTTCPGVAGPDTCSTATSRYLSGFSGSLGYLVTGRTDAEILGDSRYWLQMEAEAPGFTLVRSGPSHGLWALVAERLKALGLRRVGFESQHLTFDQHQRLSAALPGEHTLVAIAGLMEELRIVKTPEEIELLRAVAAIAGRAFDRVRGAIRPGLRERDIAFLLEPTSRELGG